MSLKRFSTFEGVFTPCLLSILGVIMYLRLGWVVGQGGLGSALIIIVIANLISLSTALSMSSIVTNIRIGTGGAYSIIAKSLGIEAGGAIGIPLYISQSISVAFYIAGFSECWISVFPQHDMLMVSLAVWLAIGVVSYYSTKFAFQLQYIILTIIALSLISVALGGGTAGGTTPLWFDHTVNDFWKIFAIFFPAVTGILTGAAMSGELKDPKESIPRGTLWAIAVSFCIYSFLAVWFARNASANELITNNSIIIDLGRWKWLVVAGIMGATLSSALSMFVGSPRTLMALSKHSIIPFSKSFARINQKGEPTTAVLLTALIVLVTLFLGSLDSVANLLTMFFLITYGIINLSVFIEQTIGIASFRPTFRISKFISFFGSISCFAVMLIINVKFSIIAFILIIAIYFLLLRREAKIHSPDVRSGLLVFIAEQLAKAASRLPYHPKIWKPNIIVPIRDIKSFVPVVPFINAIISPNGRVFIFKILEKASYERDAIKEKLLSIVQPLKDDELFVEASVVESHDYYEGSTTIMQAMKDRYFPPNTLFCLFPRDENEDAETVKLIKKAEQEGLGIILLKYDEQMGFSQEKVVNLWIRRGTPNIDLSILIALQLKNNWEGHVRIIMAVEKEFEVEESKAYLDKLVKIMRLPLDIEISVLVGEFKNILLEAPPADINIFGMAEEPNLKWARETFSLTKTSVLLLRDSKHESAMA